MKPYGEMPLSIRYKDYKIISMPPGSSGGVATINYWEWLKIIHLRDWGVHSREAIHLMVEAERRVYADRAEYLGDPDFLRYRLKTITNKDYLIERMS